MTAPTPTQRTQWRQEATSNIWSAAVPNLRILALLDALDATEAALAEVTARTEWLGGAA